MVNEYRRVYPSALRIDSSNFDPTVPWMAGLQLVALNTQNTHDISYQMNYGKFLENGGCGYVTKPSYMLDTKFSPSPAERFTIHIISGQQLPKPGGNQKGDIIDPFVMVHLNGNPLDTVHFRTKTVSDNGFNPVWNEVKYINKINK